MLLVDRQYCMARTAGILQIFESVQRYQAEEMRTERKTVF